MVKLQRMLIICGWCWLLVGCSAGEAPGGASPIASTPQPQGPTTTLSPPFTIDATSRWPSLPVQRITTALSDTVRIIFQGTGTPDGRYLLTKLASRFVTSKGSFPPEQIALYDTTTGKLKVIGTARDAQHGLTGYVADDHWVAWYELGLPEESTDSTWSLYVYNRDTQTTQTVVPNIQGQGIYPTIGLDQGRLVWSEVDGEATVDHAHFVVKLLDLATGKRIIIANRAVGPIIKWPWIGWGQVTGSDGSGHMQFQNMLTNESETLNVMADEFILVGTSLVYESDGHSFTYVPDIHNMSANTQNFVPSGFGANAFTINGLTFNGRYVGWHILGGSGDPYLYDLQTHQRLHFPMKYPLDGTQLTQIIGHTVTWLEDPNTPDQTAAFKQKNQDPPLIYGLANLQSVGG